MPVQRGKSRTVYRYTSGGYAAGSDLYLGGAQAASARLRVLNQSDSVDEDGPEPLLQNRKRPAGKPRRSIFQAILREAARDRAGAAACALLLAIVLSLGGV